MSDAGLQILFGVQSGGKRALLLQKWGINFEQATELAACSDEAAARRWLWQLDDDAYIRVMCALGSFGGGPPEASAVVLKCVCLPRRVSLSTGTLTQPVTAAMMH